MTKTKKIVVLSSFIILMALLIIGITYAFWQILRNQPSTNNNVAGTGCFELTTDIGTSNEGNAIRLLKTYPISDVEGLTLTPFTFTITNTCSYYATYQVNLETLNTTTLGLEYLKVGLDNNVMGILNDLDEVETTINDATTSHKLTTGGLKENASVTYNLRLWLDGMTPLESGQSKTYEGKVTIIASPSVPELTGVETIASLVKGEPDDTLDVITKDAPDSTCTNTFGYDNTTDNNLRYVGANPCNYVYFNCSTTNPEEMSSSTCEVWRIIGIMNNVDDGTGKKETRLKLIRRDSLGSYSWDTSTGSASATTEDPAVNNGLGINQWGPSTNYTTNTAYPGADLMQELNGDYLDLTLSANTTWYNGLNNQKEATFDYTKRLKESAQNMIGNAVWYTGAYNDTSVGNSNVTTPVSYQNERSTNPSANSSYHGKYCSSRTQCNDSIERTFTWTGKVGLQYPSDFGYATLGSTSMSEYTREKCINEVSIRSENYGSSTYGSCGSSSWLSDQLLCWSLSPSAYTSNAVIVGYVHSTGFVSYGYAYDTYAVYSAVYLESSVKITGGNGSESTPYTLGL